MSSTSDSEIDIIDVETYNDAHEVLKNYDTLKKTNKSLPKLSRYEEAKIIGLRAQQLALGAKPCVDPDIHTQSVVEIAEKELQERKIPFIIKRKIGNEIEYWKMDDIV